MAFAGQPEGFILNSSHFVTPTNTTALPPSPLMKNGSAKIQIYGNFYFKCFFRLTRQPRDSQNAMWSPRVRDDLGREWMLFCYDDPNGVVHLILDCLTPGPLDKVEQLKDTKVMFKLIVANNKNEFRNDDILAHEDVEDGNPKITVQHNFIQMKKLDIATYEKRELISRFQSSDMIVMVTIGCKIAEDHLEFSNEGTVKHAARRQWPS